MRITRQTQLFTIATVNAADLPRCGSSPDPKRLKLPLSPPRARPAGAKSTERARRPTFGQFKHCTTISPTIQQPLSNPAPTIGNLNQSSSVLQPPRNREPITTTPQSFPNNNPVARSRQTDDPALGKHPRLNHPSCRIQERFRLNRPTSTILESTIPSCMALARPSTASVAASLPTPPATRRKSPSCWQWCNERCRRRETQTLAKRVFCCPCPVAVDYR